ALGVRQLDLAQHAAAHGVLLGARAQVAVVALGQVALQALVLLLQARQLGAQDVGLGVGAGLAGLRGLGRLGVGRGGDLLHRRRFVTLLVLLLAHGLGPRSPARGSR